HDTLARAVCLTDSPAIAEAVRGEVARQCPRLPRAEIAGAAVRDHGAVVVTRDLAEALEIANRLAPEHLELAVADPFGWLPAGRHAGAIFLGPPPPEVVGDYLAGPNHVLPTGATARFASGLSVEDFVKRSSLVHYTPSGLRAAWPHLARLAEAEGLQAHREAARPRVEPGEDDCHGTATAAARRWGQGPGRDRKPGRRQRRPAGDGPGGPDRAEDARDRDPAPAQRRRKRRVVGPDDHPVPEPHAGGDGQARAPRSEGGCPGRHRRGPPPHGGGRGDLPGQGLSRGAGRQARDRPLRDLLRAD